MIKNYIKVVIRNIIRNRSQNVINILGLAVGMTVFILIFFLVQYEFSFDEFHKNQKLIYRVEQIRKNINSEERIPLTPAPLAAVLKSDFPEILDTVRIRGAGGYLFYGQEKKFFEGEGFFVDESFFTVFTFPFAAGDPNTALKDPNSILLTEELAEKYFGKVDPIGKTLKFLKSIDLIVTGVIKDPPENSHLDFTFILPFSLLDGDQEREVVYNWKDDHFYTYVLMQDIPVLKEENKKIQDILNNYREQNEASQLYLRPLTKIHLYSNTNYEITSTFPAGMLFIIFALGVLILVVACINYMTLATALASSRGKEVGIRKVVGSSRLTLVKQFLSESILFAFFSLILALLLVEIFLPVFRQISGVNFPCHFLTEWRLFLNIFLITLAVGIISGSYPAFVLSSFRPVRVLKGDLSSKAKKGTLRKVLVTLQFATTIILIILSIVFFQLGKYLQNLDLGFEKDNILVQYLINMSEETTSKYPVFRNELLKNQNILNVSASSHLACSIYSQIEVSWEDRGEEERTWITRASIDEEFIKLYEIDVILGRSFSKEFATDSENACLINETAARLFGWNDFLNSGDRSPLGKHIKNQGRDITIVGVVKDFHSTDLRLAIKPLMMSFRGESLSLYDYYSIRISSKDVARTTAFIRDKYREFFPEEIYDFRFLSDILDETFVEFKNWNKIFVSVALLAVFIASLGLFALASFMTKARTKEIGIRKVVGASAKDIFLLLAKEFSRIILISILVGWPVSYLLMNTLLQQFTYRMGLQFWVFFLAAFITVTVAIITVSTSVIKAAIENPVEALRYE
jgi:putative ABC transport system permease protein